ncbi:MAG: BrnT family toxin [Gemmatimonadota bacterium]
MKYEWDPAKARVNRRKHGVRFADAVLVFSDSAALTLADPHRDEERFVTVGMDGLARVLVVVWTWRGEKNIRLISARRATRREREQYARGGQ